MGCHNIQEQMYRFLDGEMPPIESTSIQAHLEHCADCQSTFAATQELEDWLRHTLREEQVPSSLWARIQSKIDHLELTASSARQSRPRLQRSITARFWPAVAAAICVLALGLVLLPPLLQTPASLQARLLSVPVNDLHTFVASQRALDMPSPEPRTLRQWFQQKVPFPPPLMPKQLGSGKLAGGRLCYFLDRRVASYMYTVDGRYISLYVMLNNDLPTPPESLEVLKQPMATVHDVQGYTHVIWADTGLLYSLVSDIPKSQLFEMARHVVPVGVSHPRSMR